MPVFIYKAVTKNGQVVSNKVEENNKFQLLRKLKKNGLTPITVVQRKSNKTVKKQRRNVESNSSVLKSIRYEEIQRNVQTGRGKYKKRILEFIHRNQRVTKKDIVIFTQNFYLLKKANFNNIHALTTIINTTENPTLKGILEDILVGVEAGEYMYTTMEYYEGIFPPIYINMIKVGELSGSLTNALEQAVEYLDETMALNKKIKGILIPNLLQFLGLFALLIFGSLVSIPMIQNVFAEVGSQDQLPALTIAFSHFLDRLVEFWYIPVGVIVAVVAAILWYIHTPKGKYNWHYFKYRMPVFGPLIYAIEFSRLVQALLLNLKNGMRVQEALETSKHISNNLVMLSLIESALNNILIGQSWIEPFEKSGLSSPMITEMLQIGMQTDLTEMMEKLLEYMKIDINEIMQRIMKVLPQIVYIIVGILLIFVTIVVLVPLIQVYTGTWLFSAYL